MAKFETTLKVIQSVNAGEEVADSLVIPADLKKIVVRQFCGDAPFSANSAVCAVWDYGGVSPQILWVTKGSQSIDLDVEIKNMDGIKKIAVLCGNGESGPIFMAGSLKVELHS